jgi:hypothetical protein
MQSNLPFAVPLCYIRLVFDSALPVSCYRLRTEKPTGGKLKKRGLISPFTTGRNDFSKLLKLASLSAGISRRSEDILTLWGGVSFERRLFRFFGCCLKIHRRLPRETF